MGVRFTGRWIPIGIMKVKNPTPKVEGVVWSQNLSTPHITMTGNTYTRLANVSGRSWAVTDTIWNDGFHYWEVKTSISNFAGDNGLAMGFLPPSYDSLVVNYQTFNPFGHIFSGYVFADGLIWNDAGSYVKAIGSVENPNTVYMIAWNANSGYYWIGKNGTWLHKAGESGNPTTTSGSAGSVGRHLGSARCFLGNVYGTSHSCSVTAYFNNFTYTPPSGFS